MIYPQNIYFVSLKHLTALSLCYVVSKHVKLKIMVEYFLQHLTLNIIYLVGYFILGSILSRIFQIEKRNLINIALLFSVLFVRALIRFGFNEALIRLTGYILFFTGFFIFLKDKETGSSTS